MAKSFKDHYIENSDKVQVSNTPTLNIEEIESIKPINKPIMENNTFHKEVLKTEIRSEIETKLTEEVENKIRTELTEKFEHEMAAFKQQLSESFMTGMVNTMNSNNDILIKVISALTKKVESLQESLSIEIPAPVVNVTMPARKVTRKVHRDSKDRITEITEHDEEE
jgi:hypothetical protein